MHQITRISVVLITLSALVAGQDHVKAAGTQRHVAQRRVIPIGRVVIRNASAKDTGRVLDYYRKNKHPFISSRGEAEIIRACTERRIFIAEGSVKHSSPKTIHGVSGIFPDRKGLFIEGGATRVTLGGLGLQNLFMMCRAVHSCIALPRMYLYYSAMNKDNKRSRKNLLSIGFKEMRHPLPELLDVKKAELLAEHKAPATIPRELSLRKFYYLPPREMGVYARKLLRESRDVVHTRKSRQDPNLVEAVTVRVDPDILKNNHSANAIRQLAQKRWHSMRDIHQAIKQ
jgi:hypothetical protein